MLMLMRNYGVTEAEDVEYLLLFSLIWLFNLVFSVQVFTRTRKLVYSSDQCFPSILGSARSFLWLLTGLGMFWLLYKHYVQLYITQMVLCALGLAFIWLPTSR